MSSVCTQCGAALTERDTLCPKWAHIEAMRHNPLRRDRQARIAVDMSSSGRPAMPACRRATVGEDWPA